MPRRPSRFLPGLEPLDARRPLSAGAATAPLADRIGSRALAAHPARTLAATVPQGAGGVQAEASLVVHPLAVKPNFGFLVYRVTNPNRFNNHLTPPFGQVLVQTPQPVPGQVYNVLYVAVRNGTAQTFDAGSGFTVTLPGQPASFPILTGDEQWQPGQEFVFYVLTKRYYPLHNQVSDGFQFDLGGAHSVAIPGPSGIFLRIKYDPATFPRILDGIVAFGPGAQGGIGVKFGMPDTALYEFVSARTKRNDYGGLF
jgi:hypothetical protein